jgi:hypothetical protein
MAVRPTFSMRSRSAWSLISSMELPIAMLMAPMNMGSMTKDPCVVDQMQEAGTLSQISQILEVQ